MHSLPRTERAHLAGFEPSADTVEVEGMVAHTCDNKPSLLAHVSRLIKTNKTQTYRINQSNTSELII
jgi:hypothetical protein